MRLLLVVICALSHVGKNPSQYVFSYNLTASQTDSVPTYLFKCTGLNYKDYVVTDHSIWAVTEKDSLILINISNEIHSYFRYPDITDVSCITKDNYGHVVVAKKSGEIMRCKEGVWMQILKTKSTPSSLFFSSQNVCYVITPNGIVCERDTAYHLPLSARFGMFDTNDDAPKAIGKPYCSYMDSKDRIWLGYDFGEWGNEELCYDTRNNIFDRACIDWDYNMLYSSRSFFENDSGTVFATSSLSHMGADGLIYRWNEKVKGWVLVYDRSDGFNRTTPGNSEYIGPGAFNRLDGCLYYYSDRGFCRQIKRNGWPFEFEVYLNPNLWWTWGQAHAAGYGMNVEKFEFLNNGSLVFLSTSNGIGVYNGKILKLYQ